MLVIATIAAANWSAACDDSTEPEGRIVEGVDFDLLFAPPTQGEIDAVLADWAGRDVSAKAVSIVAQQDVQLGATQATVRIVEHAVGDVQHYGAILVPAGAEPGTLPILMYAHGGDVGIDVDEVLAALPLFLGDDVTRSVFVAPSFRSEPLTFDGITRVSDGPPSPWDRDVDDALALLSVVRSQIPEANPELVAVLGFSRGAAVALLMAERDPGIDMVVEFFGPTDFLGPFVEDAVRDALRGELRDLPGLAFLDAEYIQPLKNGEIGIPEARSQLIRRSAVYYAERLPRVQIHHGTADAVVPVGEAGRLIDVLVALGRSEPDFEYYLYEGGGHDPLSLTGSIPRTREFLGRLLTLVSLIS